MSNASNMFYGDGSNLKFNTITTTGNNNITFSTPVSSTSSLIFQTAGTTRFYVGAGGATQFYGWIGLLSTAAGSRMITNTYYNLNDTDTTEGGTLRGQLYTNATNCV